jgi:tRNA threonylcarbamoyladenosine biosynthesis protein TsaB
MSPDGKSAPQESRSAGPASVGLLLAIDTCGPTGSVALAQLAGERISLLGETELAGRTYSATLVVAIGELLAAAGTQLADLHSILVVNGPGSFTGVRVGLSAAKGLAEVTPITGVSLLVLAVSRLEVLAFKAAAPAAALDAHRGEVFLRIGEAGEPGRELLANLHELASIVPPATLAVCDDGAAKVFEQAWPALPLIRVAAPSAADALRLCAPRVAVGEFPGQFADLALLDGHYLRRSDAEIFGGRSSEAGSETGAPPRSV